MPELQAVIQFVEMHQQLAYLILFLVMLWEGETFLIIAGVLLHLGALHPTPVFLVSFSGVLAGDVLWYGLGRGFSGRELPRPFAFIRHTAERVVDKMFPHFRTKPFLSLFIAKFVYGTNHASLILSGLIKMPFPLFMRAEVVASFIWIIVFLGLGFMFGYAAIQVSTKASILFLTLLLLIAGFLSVQRFLSYLYGEKRDKF